MALSHVRILARVYVKQLTGACDLPTAAGHLWQERFHSFSMDKDYLLAGVTYVERNPVVAKLCVHPEDWKWPSARIHINGENDRLARVKPMLNRVDRWSAYRSDTGKSNEEELIQSHARTGRPSGSPDFVRNLEIITGEELAPKRSGRKSATHK